MNEDISKLFTVLLSDQPSRLIKENESFFFKLIPELEKCVNFEQKNKWHIYDVYEHILHVIDGVDKDIILRLSALFHDLGKPYTFTLDENNVGHFKEHYKVSCDIFTNFCHQYQIDDSLKEVVLKLIYYHDIDINRLNEDEFAQFIKNFNQQELLYLFNLKRSDLLAQNSIYHYLLNEYDELEKKLIINN